MDRRQFLAAAASGVSLPLLTESSASAQATRPAGSGATAGADPFRLDSPPVLQCPTSDGVTVVWAVTGPSAGWVEYGTTEQLGQTARAAHRGLTAYEPRYHAVRLSGLKPGESIFYRAVSAPVTFNGAYKIVRGEPTASRVYRYTPTSAANDRGSFAVMNDTHEREPTLTALTDRLAADPADLTVWNGDIFDDIRSDDQVVNNVLRPAGAAFAAEKPLLFSAGNHDHRGVAARTLVNAMAPWPQTPDLPWCYAVRSGPIAVIGLDTGEDKPDAHPVWAGLAAFEPYRVAQRDWLRATLQRPDIASAPFLVVCCHIPLVGRPGDNGGDTLEGYAAYCKQGQTLWEPLLSAAGVSVVISGHTHRHRYDAPAGGRSYGQLVGGGPKLEAATLIRGVADAKQLRVTATDLAGKELGAWTYAPRKV